jgi:deazaflavin-dependent oxidoreductase (nitroreductase family)
MTEGQRSMPRQLKYVDPCRRRTWLTRAYVAVGTGRLGRFISRHVFWKLDPVLLRATGGRFGGAFPIRTAVLETRGAKSGASRRNAVIYFHDGERVTIVASHAGYARHPAWFHNLRANPDVVFGGVPMRATVVSDEEALQRVWSMADCVFPPYAKYRRAAAKTNRTIPIVQLTTREAEGGS